MTAPVNPDERFCDLVIARLKTGTAMAVITITNPTRMISSADIS